MNIVTNTGPLIALAKINQLALLSKLFASVSIPPAVHRELLAKSGPEADRLDDALHQIINVTAVPDFPAEVLVATDSLGAGEKQAVALAYIEKTILVIDERLGRTAARQLGLTVTGSTGILITAKQRGLIPHVIPLLHDIRRYGYWLSDELIATAAKLTGETE